MNLNKELSNYTSEKMCEYKGRLYSVRDNGAIYRHSKEGSRIAKLDNTWTFGRKNEKNGYMLHGSVRVHQIVATAFHGNPPEPNMVVDHIDTNRCNNRPENLQWVTRLENALNNPITRQKIIYYCGSIEAFIENPSILRENTSEPNLSWMRTVTVEEAAICKRNLSRWAEMDNKSKTQQKRDKFESGLGEWIYTENIKSTTDEGFEKSWDTNWRGNSYQEHLEGQAENDEGLDWQSIEESPDPIPSLTEGAYQLYWKIPTEFPQCPKSISSTPLQDYLLNLTAGVQFCHNDIYYSNVINAEMNADGNLIAVMTDSPEGFKRYALSVITFKDNHFIHESCGTFFKEDGAEKYYTQALGREWKGGEVFDDFC